MPYVGNRVDIAFEFDLATAILQSLQRGSSSTLISTQNRVLESYPFGQYAIFLTNHDQNRVLSQLAGNGEAAKVAATLLLTNPGVPFIYYGEEIGMIGQKPDERIRTPMQWDGTRISGGFSTDSPWQPMQTGYRAVNVAAQTDDPNSLLNHYRTLVNLRNSYPALQTGDMHILDSGNAGVYSFLRYDDDEVILVLVNLTDEVITDYGLTMEAASESLLLYGEGEIAAPVPYEPYQPVPALAPYASLVIQLQ